MTTRPRARSSPPAATTPPASPRFSSPEKCGDGAHPHRCGRLLACCADGERAAHDDCRGMHGADHVRRLHSRRSEEHTSELQSRGHLVCRLLLEKKTTVASRMHT